MTTTLTGRRGKIQSAFEEWQERPTGTVPYFLATAIYAAVLENEDDFEGLDHAIDRGLVEFSMTPGQDLVEVVYYSIERAQRLATSTWTAPHGETGATPFSRPNGI
jgi:hypothetical protein